MKTFKALIEGTFNVQDVMGYPVFIVTNGKEIFSDTGEVSKFYEHDVWKSPKKYMYKGFLFTDKKEAEALAKEISVDVKEINVSIKL